MRSRGCDTSEAVPRFAECSRYRSRFQVELRAPPAVPQALPGRAAAAGSAATALLGVLIASTGAGLVGSLLLLLAAVGLGLYARHWLAPAGRSRVGARSEDEVHARPFIQL